MNRHVAAYIPVVLGLTVAMFQWWEIGYRLHLYYNHYHCQRYANHVGDGTFATAYVVDGIAVVLGILGLRALRSAPRGARVFATVPVTLNVLGAVVLFLMHRAAMLVEYTEFIRHARLG